MLFFPAHGDQKNANWTETCPTWQPCPAAVTAQIKLSFPQERALRGEDVQGIITFTDHRSLNKEELLCLLKTNNASAFVTDRTRKQENSLLSTLWSHGGSSVKDLLHWDSSDRPGSDVWNCGLVWWTHVCPGPALLFGAAPREKGEAHTRKRATITICEDTP